jgi:hypothetical protein
MSLLGYLDKHQNTEMVFDPTDPAIKIDLFNHKDWSILSLEQRLTNRYRTKCLKHVDLALPFDADRATS